jgi:hypothetical protein
VLFAVNTTYAVLVVLKATIHKSIVLAAHYETLLADKRPSLEVRNVYKKAIQVINMDFIEKIKLIMGNSDKFYNSVKGEDLGPPIKYLALLLLIPTIFTVFFVGSMASFLTPLMNMIPADYAIAGSLLQMLGPIFGLYMAGMYYISSFVGSFISAAVLHVVVYFMGAKKGFENTFKAVVYGGTPSTIFSWIPLVNIVFMFWSWFLLVKGLSKLQNMTMEKAFIATLVPLIIVIVFGMLFWAIFAIAGVSSGMMMDPSMFVFE